MTAEGWHYAGSVTRQHGAWFVHASDPRNDSTTDEVTTCAANREVAKRLLCEMADHLGFGGRHRWDTTRAPVSYALEYEHELSFDEADLDRLGADLDGLR